MPRPLIGITTSDYKSQLAWCFDWFAVWRHGGRPLRLSPSRPLPEHLDGLIIGGGDDIQAHLYGGEVQLDVRLDPARDELELHLLKRFIPRHTPVLGICRGAQLINVHLGQDMIPGAGLQQYFGSKATGDVFNAMGLANPAVDALITQVEAATTQDELTTRVHALDRTLRALRFWVPQWYKGTHTVAYWDMYGHPDALPPFALGELDFWWYDADKAAKLKEAGAIR